MAITVNNTSTGQASISSSTTSYSHTCSGDNRLLIVAAINTSAVTYAGVSMTKLANPGTVADVSFYYLLNPTLGANNIVLTKKGADSFGAVSISYNGVNQKSFPDAYDSVSQNNVPLLSDSITTVKNNCLVVWGVGVRETALAGGTGTTLRIRTHVGALADVAIFDNNAQVNAGTTVTLTTTNVGNQPYWNGVIASIEPFTNSVKTNWFL